MDVRANDGIKRAYSGLPIIFYLMLPQCVDSFLGLILSREGSPGKEVFLAVETSSIVNISTNYNPFIKDLGDEISFLSNMVHGNKSIGHWYII